MRKSPPSSFWESGFSFLDLRRLQRAGGHCIAGQKLRAGKDSVGQILEGRPLKAVRNNLEVKEAVVGQGERRIRYVLVRNPKEVGKDKARREKILARIKEELKAVGASRNKCSITRL